MELPRGSHSALLLIPFQIFKNPGNEGGKFEILDVKSDYTESGYQKIVRQKWQAY